MAKETVSSKFSGVSISQIKLGLKGYAGNKGAIGFRFDLLGSSVCIINVHLPPHKHNFKLRNQNVITIYRELKFSLKKTSKSIFEHDYIFWLGDLNYRLDCLSTKKIINYISLSDFNSCLEYDQLNNAKKLHGILEDFNEGDIDFLPTFKYLIGSNQHNLKRDPAWCDRILWKGNAILDRYGSCDSIQISDHKPVFSYFNLNLKKKDLNKMEQVKSQIYNEIDKKHREDTPKVSVSTNKIVFDNVRYKTESIQTFSIENKGKSSLKFKIKNEYWIKCTPKEYLLNSGDCVTITACLVIDSSFLHKYRNLKVKSPIFLKIKVLKGNSLFVEADCDFVDTFIGYSCDTLSLKMPSKKFSDLPNPLVRIIEYLKHEGIKLNNLFEVSVDQNMILHIINKIDNNEDFDETINAYGMIAVLHEFLRGLETPLIKPDKIESKVNVVHIIGPDIVKIQVLETMTPTSVRCLNYITEFIKLLISNSSHNELNPYSISKAMHYSFFQKDSNPKSKKKQIQFLEILFNN